MLRSFGRSEQVDRRPHSRSAERIEAIVDHLLGVGSPRPWLGTRRVLLVGDAVGAAERLLGNGIYNALATGQSAAAAVLATLRAGGDAGVAYADAARAVADHLERCDRMARPFDVWPSVSCALLGIPAVGHIIGDGLALCANVDERLGRSFAALWPDERSGFQLDGPSAAPTRARRVHLLRAVDVVGSNPSAAQLPPTHEQAAEVG